MMNGQINRREFVKSAGMAVPALGMCQSIAASAEAANAPNILWICVEDMSPNMSCYGERTIKTPNIDRLAKEGVLFTNASVTCPVCSPSRSALITGMYQTTIGAHNHRSSRHEVKIHLPDHVHLVPEYFKEAGYFTSNGGMIALDPKKKTKVGKTDYNFIYSSDVYDGADWRARKPGQPFFAQIQLRGGKNRKARIPNPVDPDEVELPPYYPGHPVLREDWADYLDSVVQTDIEVGEILDTLEEEGELERTVVFFWTDHGISHVRDKQFLYEGGIHIPLIVRGPGVESGKQIHDLVEHIDIPATSMRLAGIPVPDHLQGRDLLVRDAEPRECVVAARDRCDETVERIRCVRTKHYKYIRNYFPDRPQAQSNRYKDGKPIMITMRRLFAEGKLTPEQARPFLPTRPVEELYDLASDPHELHNLAEAPEHQTDLVNLRTRLTDWMDQTGDLGQIPEPALAELAEKLETPYAILGTEHNRTLVNDLRAINGQQLAIGDLVQALRDQRPEIRYGSAVEIARLAPRSDAADEALLRLLEDPVPYVRVGAARAISRMGIESEAVPVLLRELQEADCEVVRHYAALGLEDLGVKAYRAYDALKAAREDPYEYVQRVATRAVATLENQMRLQSSGEGVPAK